MLVESVKFVIGQAALLAYRALQHYLGAAADQGSGTVQRDSIKPANYQRMVHRHTQIMMCIEQSTVEVEADSSKGKFRHMRCGGGSCFKPQPFGAM